MKLSILVPTYQEEAAIVPCLECAQQAAPEAEIIVVDGGSSDATIERASPLARIITAPRGRGRQLNAAAHAASGDVLLFLHADTLLPAVPVEAPIARSLQDPAVIGGNFQVVFAPSSPEARLLQLAYQLVRRLGIFYGDSAIFVRRTAFLARGGFQQQQLMEDVELVRWMRCTGRLVQLPLPVVTSSRRFHGRTLYHLGLWALLQSLYALGVPDAILERFYPSRQSNSAS